MVPRQLRQKAKPAEPDAEEESRLRSGLVDKIRRMEPTGSKVERGFRPFSADPSV